MSRDPAADERGAQSIHRALTVLEAFRTLGPTLTLTEISDFTGLTVPTAHRMVKAFVSREYLVQNQITGRYALGPAIVHLARVVTQRANSDQLISLALPYLEEMRGLTGETAGLHVRVDTQRLCIAEIVSSHSVRMSSGVGQIFPLNAGAASKAILAFLPQEEREVVLHQLSYVGLAASTITDEATLRDALQAVRTLGYAMSIGESVAGASGLAAPIFGADGVFAAINLAGPADRWTPIQMSRVVPDLLRITAEISSQLGYVSESPAPTTDEDRDGTARRKSETS
jgi:IclR family transcriptional regulator, KDG regulon repressor